MTADERAHPPTEGEGPAERRMHRPGRLNALSDGIFAIAMTLLALEIQVPERIADDAGFGAEMATFFGSLGVFVVAFFITAQYWLGHHRVMSYVHTVDRRGLSLAVLALLGISALPAATRLIVGVEAHWQSVVTASGMLAVTSLLSVRFYAHVLRPEFADIRPDTRRRILAAPSINVAVYLLTIVAALGLNALGLASAYAFVLWWLLALNGIIARLIVRSRTAPPQTPPGSRTQP